MSATEKYCRRIRCAANKIKEAQRNPSGESIFVRLHDLCIGLETLATEVTKDIKKKK